MAEVNPEISKQLSSQQIEESLVHREIPKELSAVVFPELGKRDEYNNLQPIAEEEAMSQLNSFLAELNQRGADIVSTLDVNVAVNKTDGTGSSVEQRKVAIVRQPKQG